MNKIYFVRHGESEHNKMKKYAGSIDSPLTELGISQAKETGKLLIGKNITHIITSNLSRALDTALEIKKVIDPENSIPLDVTPLLREVNFGDIQGESYGDVGGLNYGITSGTGDSAQMLIERAQKAISMIRSVDTTGNILVVGHGSFTSVIFAVQGGKGEEDLIEYRNQWSFHNGEIRELS